MENWESRVRYAAIVQYDGTAYSGFQIQHNADSIQSRIEHAVKVLTREDVRIISAGRTDAGVHALGQVAHFDLHNELAPDRLCIGLNGILPADIAVKCVARVDSRFHARFSALAREYHYIIYNHPFKSPFIRYRAMWVKEPIDIEYCRTALSYCLGMKDFASFCKKSSSEMNTVRHIDSVDVHTMCRELVVFTIKGNGFLHNMVRIIVGTILTIMKNHESPQKMQNIIDKCDRSYGGITAPSYGLYLNKVYYPSDYDFLNM